MSFLFMITYLLIINYKRNNNYEIEWNEKKNSIKSKQNHHHYNPFNYNTFICITKYEKFASEKIKTLFQKIIIRN